MYSLSHISAVHYSLCNLFTHPYFISLGVSKESINNSYLLLEKAINKLPNTNLGGHITSHDVKQLITCSNKLYPWTDTISNYNSWYLIHKLLVNNLSNEGLFRKSTNYKLVFSIGMKKFEEIVEYNPIEDKENLIASYALREGYWVEPKKEHLLIKCPSGQSRAVTASHCNCPTFIKTNKQKRPCIHLTLANAFLKNRKAFKY